MRPAPVQAGPQARGGAADDQGNGIGSARTRRRGELTADGERRAESNQAPAETEKSHRQPPTAEGNVTTNTSTSGSTAKRKRKRELVKDHHSRGVRGDPPPTRSPYLRARAPP